jgi:hypothetical protein
MEAKNCILCLIISFLLACFFLWSRPAKASLSERELAQRIAIVAPATGASFKVVKAENAEIYAVVADYEGGPLPGKRSIVLGLDQPDSGRVHASFFQGQYLLPFQTKPAWVSGIGKIPKQTQFAIWQEGSGEWGAMTGLVGGGMRTFLEGTGDKVSVVADSLADNFAPKRVPMFAIGWDRDPYKLIHALYVHGFAVMHAVDPDGVVGRLRVEKPYPDIFRYVGWCSWNAHYRNIDAQKLLEHAKSFKQSGFPLRWMLIDDCWSTVNTSTMLPWSQGNLFLTGLAADPVKFPDGLAATVNAIKQDYGITWVGAWHTFSGYWNGIALDSEVGRDYAEALMPVSEKAGIPDPRSAAGERFWEAWYKYMADSGIDFVKVDNQGTLSSFLKGAIPISTAMAQGQLNLQRPAEKYFHGNVLNCMEMNVDTVFQWETTNLGRAATDYVPISYHNPRMNTLTNVINSLWFSEVSYPDYDMFMTHDGHPEYFATARAISGGPVYTTDKAGQEKWEVLWPLVLKDGLVIRTDTPGLPVRKNILHDPLIEGMPLAAFARVGDGGVLAAWNVDRLERPVKMSLAPSDVEGIAGERFAVYEHFSGALKILGRDEEFEVKLPGWGIGLYSVVPIKDGFAAIGLDDKYISAGTVRSMETGPGRARVRLAQGGPFAAWCEEEPKLIKVNGAEIDRGRVEDEKGLLKFMVADDKDKEGGPELEIIWR